MANSRFKNGFAMIDPWIYHPNFGLSKNDLRVYGALASFADANTAICFPTREQLNAITGIHETNISKCITKMVNKGLMLRQSRYNSSNIITLLPIILSTDLQQMQQNIVGGGNNLT